MSNRIRWFIVYVAFAIAVFAVLMIFSPLRILFLPSGEPSKGVAAMFRYPDEVFEDSAEEQGENSIVIEQVSSGITEVGQDPYSIVVSGPRKLRNVVKHISLNLVSFRYWYLQSGYDVKDTAIITFTILSNGMVEGVALDSSFSVDESFKLQLISQIENFEFYQNSVAEKTFVRYPLRFLGDKQVY